jgi:hypothetical protein
VLAKKKKENVCICYYARSVDACPFQNVYHARYFYLVIEISHTEPHSCTEGWNVCAAPSFLKLKPDVLPSEVLLSLRENSVQSSESSESN